MLQPENLHTTVREGPSDQKVKKVKSEKNKKEISYPTRKKVGLKPANTLAEAGRKVLSFHFARMLEHEPGTRLGEDSEDLHNMRVAIRRMRTALNLFGDGFSKKSIKPLRKGLKETGRILGNVRDLDIFTEELQSYQQSLPQAEQADLQPLLDTWQAKREMARKEMLSYLDDKAYSTFKQYLLKFIKTKNLGLKSIPDKALLPPRQLRHITPGLIYRAYETVRAYETILDKATQETLHELRKALKEFRYTLEFFQEILGVEKKPVIQDIKTLQDHLGALNDANVAGTILRDFLAEWEQHQRHRPLAERQSPTGLVAYLDKKLNKEHDLLVSFPEAWVHFNRPEFRQNLAKAISVL